MTANPDQGNRPQRGQPTYMHKLYDWPNFRWDAEAVAPLLEHTDRRHMKISTAAPRPQPRRVLVLDISAADCPERVEDQHEPKDGTTDDF